MPEYALGTPSWIELSSSDTDASVELYGELMGCDPQGASFTVMQPAPAA